MTLMFILMLLTKAISTVFLLLSFISYRPICLQNFKKQNLRFRNKSKLVTAAKPTVHDDIGREAYYMCRNVGLFVCWC